MDGFSFSLLTIARIDLEILLARKTTPEPVPKIPRHVPNLDIRLSQILRNDHLALQATPPELVHRLDARYAPFAQLAIGHGIFLKIKERKRFFPKKISHEPFPE